MSQDMLYSPWLESHFKQNPAIDDSKWVLLALAVQHFQESDYEKLPKKLSRVATTGQKMAKEAQG